MREVKTRWAICPVEDCNYAVECEEEESFLCPSCEVELVTKCEACQAPVHEEEQVICSECGAGLKQ